MKQAHSEIELAEAIAPPVETHVGSASEAGEPSSSLSSSEVHILRCLGAAVIDQWSTLPTSVQRVLFERAAALGAPRHVFYLKEQIASFLRSRKSAGPVL